MSRSRTVIVGAFALVVGILQPWSAAAVRAQGPQEGIKVHGYWRVDITNPDGTPAGHQEFENSLAGGYGGGGTTLTALLTGQSGGEWGILLGADGGGCNSASVQCAILSTNSPARSISQVVAAPLKDNANLTVAVANPADGDQIVLTGSAVATVDDIGIRYFFSLLGHCQPASVAQCGLRFPATPSDTGFPDTLGPWFTAFDYSKVDPNGLRLKKDQTIHVTVTISFS